MKTLLATTALLCAAPTALAVQAGAPQSPETRLAPQDQLPPEWRDRSAPELRKAFDRLEGKPAPSLAGLQHWAGTDARSWQDLRGQVVLIDMWATWCKPCLDHMGELERLSRLYASDGLVVLGVHSATRFDAAAMNRLARVRGLSYALAADTERELTQALGVQSLPSYFVVDREGVVRVAGADRNKLADITRHLLAEDGRTLTATADWPRYVAKKLYAEHDLRGRQAPQLEVEAWLSAQPDTRDKVVVVDLWATWCKPCHKLIPELNAWSLELADTVSFIGVSNENAETVRAFLARTPLRYSVAVDERERLYDALGVQGIPHVLVISSDGVVRWQGYPFEKEDPLTLDLLKSIARADAAAREQAARKQADDE